VSLRSFFAHSLAIDYFVTATGLGSNPSLRKPLCTGADKEDVEVVVDMLLERRALAVVGTMMSWASGAISRTGSMTDAAAAGRVVGARVRNWKVLVDVDIVEDMRSRTDRMDGLVGLMERGDGWFWS